MINITDSNDSFIIKKSDAIVLELKLNLSSKKNQWKELGDMLYSLGRNKEPEDTLVVTSEQLSFLKMLQKLSGLKDSALV